MTNERTDHTMTPTPAQVAEDLSLANEIGGYYGYGYSQTHDAVIVEQYSDEGDVVATHLMRVTFEEVQS